MNEKKKTQPNRKVTLVIFALLWLTLLGAVKYSIFRFGFEVDVFQFVNSNAPAFLLKRLWLFYLLEGLGYGLFIGLAQKLAINLVSNVRLKYWVRATALSSVVASFILYFMVRFNFLYFNNMLLNTPFFNLSLVVMSISQWLILNKHFRQAWLWLLPIFPSILLEFSRWNRFQPMWIDILQAALGVLVFIWISRQTNSDEKLKNTAEAEARLSDNLTDEDEIQGISGNYQASEA